MDNRSRAISFSHRMWHEEVRRPATVIGAEFFYYCMCPHCTNICPHRKVEVRRLVANRRQP
jgi:hypothetical protein